jgi:hypothetical protein
MYHKQKSCSTNNVYTYNQIHRIQQSHKYMIATSSVFRLTFFKKMGSELPRNVVTQMSSVPSTVHGHQTDRNDKIVYGH